MDLEHRSFIRFSPSRIDRIKLKRNDFTGEVYYFFGAFSNDTHHDLAVALRKEIQQHKLTFKLIYTGLSATIKPFQLGRVLDTTQAYGSHPTRRFKDYSGTTLPFGLDVKNSFLSLLQTYEAKFGYQPNYCYVILFSKPMGLK